MITQKILAIDPIPVKTNSSFGNWAIYVEIEVPFGNGSTQHSIDFFKKADALKWVKENHTHVKLGR
jgi:hypothetical protein